LLVLKIKKTISIFFLLAISLQLLPVKQVLDRFYTDTSLVEEAADAPEKENTSAMAGIDQDSLPPYDVFAAVFARLHAKEVAVAMHIDMQPSTHADDIETPPPNYFS
jgi:hypothetical protein